MTNVCIVLMCNKNYYYIEEYFRTIGEIRNIGNYEKDIVLMHTDDMINILETDSRFEENEFKIIYKYFSPTCKNLFFVHHLVEKVMDEKQVNFFSIISFMFLIFILGNGIRFLTLILACVYLSLSIQ